MLSDVVQRRAAVIRHRATLFGRHIDEYLDGLARQGHGWTVLRRHLDVVTRFGEHLSHRGVQRVVDIAPEHVRTFLRREQIRQERRRRAWHSSAKTKIFVPSRMLRSFLLHLESRGQWRQPQIHSHPLVDDFYRSLAIERGLRPATIQLYRWFLTKFLAHLGSDGSAVSLARLSARDVDTFLVSAGQNYSRKSMSFIGSVVRGFLRHLFRERVLCQDLAPCVILPRFYALERLPCALPWKTARRIIDVPDLKTKSGLRDRAVLALLLGYGVRPGEVVALRLEDINWRRNTICFRRSKEGRPLTFPLTLEAGEAIISYLRKGRPQTSAREVFVRCLAPHSPLSRGSVISYLVYRMLAKAGIESRHTGAGIIRHSLAIHLLRRGHPLKTISDVLGHRDPGIAYHYTKLATEDLRDVALGAREVLP